MTIHLTPREGQVMACLAEGWSYEETAHQLGISVNTVKVRAAAVYDEAGGGGMLSAFRALGWLTVPEHLRPPSEPRMGPSADVRRPR